MRSPSYDFAAWISWLKRNLINKIEKNAMLAAGTTELNFWLNNSKENVRLNDIEIKESVFPEAQKVC